MVQKGLRLEFESRTDRFQRKKNKVKLCNLKITGLFLFPHLSRMTAHLQNSMFVKYSQKQGAAICFAVGFNDVVSENAITLTFCLKIRDYDDRAFLRIEEIGSALWSNYPFYPVFLHEYLCWETKVMGLGNAKASVRQRYRMCLAIYTVEIGYATYRNGRRIRMKSAFLLHKYEIG